MTVCYSCCSSKFKAEAALCMILVILRAWNHPCDSRKKNHKNAIFCPQNVTLVGALKIRRWCQKLLYISGVMWLVMTANLVPIILAIFEKFAHMWQKSRFLTHFWTIFLVKVAIFWHVPHYWACSSIVVGKYLIWVSDSWNGRNFLKFLWRTGLGVATIVKIFLGANFERA